MKLITQILFFSVALFGSTQSKAQFGFPSGFIELMSHFESASSFSSSFNGCRRFATTHTYLNNKKVIAHYNSETGICRAMVFGKGANLPQGAGVHYD